MNVAKYLIAALATILVASATTPAHGSLDPIGHTGGVNLYEYANARPQRYVDPRGLEPELGEIGGSDNKWKPRYYYTCNCGWIDKYHFAEYARKYVDLYNAIGNNLGGGSIDIQSKQPGVIKDSTVDRTYKWNKLALAKGTVDHARFTQRMISWVAMQEEADQASSFWPASRSSGWSFEDITSNMLGALIGQYALDNGLNINNGGDLRKAIDAVVSQCHLVTQKEAEGALVTGWKSITTEQPPCPNDPCKNPPHKGNVKPFTEWNDLVTLFNNELAANIKLIGNLHTGNAQLPNAAGQYPPWKP